MRIWNYWKGWIVFEKIVLENEKNAIKLPKYVRGATPKLSLVEKTDFKNALRNYPASKYHFIHPRQMCHFMQHFLLIL